MHHQNTLEHGVSHESAEIFLLGTVAGAGPATNRIELDGGEFHLDAGEDAVGS